jgi:cysteine desulfurase/selenocysteine lyase
MKSDPVVNTTNIDWAAVKADFPVLQRTINNRRLVYLDSANTSQKPDAVIDAMTDFMRNGYAPINRSGYQIASEATGMYEDARNKVQRFINASRADEVIFTKNATESINLITQTWGRANLQTGDVVVLTHMEHHANIVPWHTLATERGIELRWIPITTDGVLDLSNLPAIIDNAKVLSFTAMSNVLGTINPVKTLCAAAHAAGAIAIVDACQFVPHNVTDVQEWGADFVMFSGHKMVGPTSVGVLWGREELLENMPPFLGGGNMIADVRLDGFTTAKLPSKFEAGTPAIAEVIGLGAAVDYLTNIGMANIRNHEMNLTKYALSTLRARYGDDIIIHGPSNVEIRGAVLSFAFRDIHAHDVSQVLDEKNVCVRAGHHCAKPLMKLLGANATARASFYLYNDHTDIDALSDALADISAIFRV